MMKSSHAPRRLGQPTDVVTLGSGAAPSYALTARGPDLAWAEAAARTGWQACDGSLRGKLRATTITSHEKFVLAVLAGIGPIGPGMAPRGCSVSLNCFFHLEPSYEIEP